MTQILARATVANIVHLKDADTDRLPPLDLAPVSPAPIAYATPASGPRHLRPGRRARLRARLAGLLHRSPRLPAEEPTPRFLPDPAILAELRSLDPETAGLVERIGAKLRGGEYDDLAKATMVKLVAAPLTVSSHASDFSAVVEIGEPVADWFTISITPSGRGQLLPFDARCLAGVLTAYADLAEASTASAARMAELTAKIEAGPQPLGWGAASRAARSNGDQP